MIEFDPTKLWIYPRNWPNAPRGYLFLVPAVELVAEKLFGDAWKNDGFLLEEYTLPPDMLAAKPEARAYAHGILQRLHGDAYTPDFETRGWVPLGSLAALGSAGNLTSLGTVQRTIQLGDPPERAEGYWFTSEQWEEVQAYLHATNLSNRPFVEMAREVSRWISDEIVDGAIRTFLFRIDEKDPRDGVAADWRFMDLDKRRRRFRNCRMTPGDPSSQTGSHVIFVHARDLAAALDRHDSLLKNPSPSETDGLPAFESPPDENYLSPESILEALPAASTTLLTSPPPPLESITPDGTRPLVRRVSRKVFNLYTGLLEHYGPLGGADTHDLPPDRASAATAWANRQNPRPPLPKDAARDVRRIDQLTERFSKPLQCK